MDVYTFVATALATYYLASAVTASLVFAKARKKYGLFDCFICTAFWIAITMTAVAYYLPVVIYPLAIAGGALLLNKVPKH